MIECRQRSILQSKNGFDLQPFDLFDLCNLSHIFQNLPGNQRSLMNSPIKFDQIQISGSGSIVYTSFVTDRWGDIIITKNTESSKLDMGFSKICRVNYSKNMMVGHNNGHYRIHTQQYASRMDCITGLPDMFGHQQ